MKAYLTTIVLLCQFVAIAQTNFQEGFIITQQKDTLTGFIDYRSDNLNAKRCTFKPTKEAKAVKYTPDELIGFRFADGRYFVAHQLPDSNERVFLEYLVDGMADVYYFHNRQGDHYFIKKPGEALTELEQENRSVVIDGERYLREDKHYVQVLRYLLSDAPALQTKINATNLSHKSLITLAKAYHEQTCTTGEACIVYEKELVKPKVSAGVLVAFNRFTVPLNDLRFPISGVIQRKKMLAVTQYPSFGLFVSTTLPPISEKLSLSYEGTYHHLKLASSSAFIEPVLNNNVEREISFQISYLAHTLTFTYALSAPRPLVPVIETGVAGHTVLSTGSVESIEISQPSEEPFLQRSYQNHLPSRFHYSLVVGGGIRWYVRKQHPLAIKIRYRRGVGLFRYASAISNTFTALVSYPIF